MIKSLLALLLLLAKSYAIKHLCIYINLHSTSENDSTFKAVMPFFISNYLMKDEYCKCYLYTNIISAQKLSNSN